MDILLISRGKAVFFIVFRAIEITSVAIICFITSYGAHLSHCAYAIVVCLALNMF